MIGLIQRVNHAKVEVAGNVIGQIQKGILLLLGVEAGDDLQKVERLVHKVLAYRIFPDHEGKMNLNLEQAGGELLVVSQFTLAAETNKGMRPGFSSAASPILAEELYEAFIEQAKRKGMTTESGQFAADMQVSLQNDGPVTFWLQV